MKVARSIASVPLLLVAVMVSGCETLEKSGFLVPQGPGNAPDGRLQRAAPPTSVPQASVKTESPAPAANSRRLDVTPELIATAPPPPARPAAEGAAGVPLSAYTQWTKYGDLVFISGQIPLDLRTNTLYDGASIEEQTRVVMENIRMILEANRLTMANVVSTTVYLKDVNTLRGMNSVYDTYFRAAPPARTVVEVNKLPRGVALQISAVAGR